MEKQNKIINILKDMKKYHNFNILIKSEAKEFNFYIKNEYIPHLLGLQYINEDTRKTRGKELFNYVLDKTITDNDIFTKIEKYHGKNQLENIKNRINTFKEFMENLEKGIVVEKTLESKMNVNYLIIQNKNNEYYHLGIYKGESGSILDTFGKMKDNDILKTYFVENNQDYFQNSKTNEKIISIERYDEQLEMYVPFSFDEEKNQKLLMEFEIKNNIDKNSLQKYITNLEDFIIDLENGLGERLNVFTQTFNFKLKNIYYALSGEYDECFDDYRITDYETKSTILNEVFYRYCDNMYEIFKQNYYEEFNINFSNDENILPYFNTSSFILKEPYRIQVYKNDDYIKKVKLNFDYVSDIDLPKQIEELKDYLLKAKKLNKNEYDINDQILDLMEQLQIIDKNIDEFYQDVSISLNKYDFIKKEKEYVDNIDEFKEYLKEEINYIINCEMELEV